MSSLMVDDLLLCGVSYCLPHLFLWATIDEGIQFGGEIIGNDDGRWRDRFIVPSKMICLWCNLASDFSS